MDKLEESELAPETYAERLLFWATRFTETLSRLWSDSKLLSMSTSSGRGGACRVYGHINNEHIYHKCTVCQKRDA